MHTRPQLRAIAVGHTRRPLLRALGYSLIALTLFATLIINFYTLAQISRARTNMPWWDEWAMVRDLALYHGSGHAPSFLWSMYWGHRLVVLRLLLQADERWASLTSRTYLSLTIQLGHLAVLLALALRLFKRSLPAALLAIAIVMNLGLSPFQMENFLWSMNVIFILVYAAATCSIVTLALGRGWRSLILCLCCALLSSATMANGLLIWPVLILEAAYLRVRRSAFIAICTVGAIVSTLYLWHYQRPPTGMTIAQIARHPLDVILLVGLLLGGPLSLLNANLGIIAGLLLLILAAYSCSRVLRNPSKLPAECVALFAILLFLFLTCAIIVPGRLTPDLLHSPAFPLPSRYFTPVCLFWASLGLVALYESWHTKRRGLITVYGLVFFGSIIATMPRQFVAAGDWADFFIGVDAIGSALLLDVPDHQLLPVLWPVEAELKNYTAYLRGRRLSIFSEPRSTWTGRQIESIFPNRIAGRCEGAIEQTTTIGDHAWRLQGWAVDREHGSSPRDLVMTDPSGRIIGLARGGFRHNYFPGLMVQPLAPPLSPLHAGSRHSEWLGFLKTDADSATPQSVAIYGVLSGRDACIVISPLH